MVVVFCSLFCHLTSTCTVSCTLLVTRLAIVLFTFVCSGSVLSLYISLFILLAQAAKCRHLFTFGLFKISTCIDDVSLLSIFYIYFVQGFPQTMSRLCVLTCTTLQNNSCKSSSRRSCGFGAGTSATPPRRNCNPRHGRSST